MVSFPRVVGIVLGSLVIAAAALKFQYLGTVATNETELQAWLNLVAGGWEILLGLWLLSGSRPRSSWAVAASTFALYAAISAVRGLAGATSCSCLGAVQASPWQMFAVDVAILTTLVIVRRPFGRSAASSSSNSLLPPAWLVGSAVAVLAAASLLHAKYESLGTALADLRGETIVADRRIDLGAGQPGESLHGTVVIRNMGNSPVHVFGGTADCTCTALRDLPLTLEPSGYGRVGFDLQVPDQTSGSMTRLIYLRTDHPDQPNIRISVRCRVE